MGVPVVQTYGLTETASQVVTLAPEDAFRKLGSAGKPLFPVEVRIALEDGTQSRAKPGKYSCGPNVMADITSAGNGPLYAGVAHTGDVGYLTTRAFYTFSTGAAI